jgi:nitrogen fixation/metabolism regulation signal transduction histidine kinase
MGFSRFRAAIMIRIAALTATLAVLIWMILHTGWYVSISLLAIAAIAEAVSLARFADRSGREVARFLDSIAFDDTSTSFTALSGNRSFAELGSAMSRVLDRLRLGRVEREEQTQYLQTLIAHVPVAVISTDEQGAVRLLNLAARRLFENSCTQTQQFTRYGEAFATGLETLPPGNTVIVRMERRTGALQLKAAATDIVLSGVRRRLISLQNIESELTAQELAAWQTVIRVMAHEVMNSLTPISSLAATAQKLVEDVLEQTSQDDPRRERLTDAGEALETMARRSEGLLHFVQNHRRLTRRMVASVDIVSLRRVFARLERLLTQELESRHVELAIQVMPETLAVSADSELLDQALINLVRNAMEALREEKAGRIMLSAVQDSEGHVVITVADNGPGIPADQREKVFVPFFTTKRQGSGVGLTLVRQIATVHGATVGISDTEGGGATISLRF